MNSTIVIIRHSPYVESGTELNQMHTLTDKGEKQIAVLRKRLEKEVNFDQSSLLVFSSDFVRAISTARLLSMQDSVTIIADINKSSRQLELLVDAADDIRACVESENPKFALIVGHLSSVPLLAGMLSNNLDTTIFRGIPDYCEGYIIENGIARKLE